MPTKLKNPSVYLTDEENEKLKAFAEESGMTVSNYVRKKLGLKPLERGRSKREKQREDKLK